MCFDVIAVTFLAWKGNSRYHHLPEFPVKGERNGKFSLVCVTEAVIWFYFRNCGKFEMRILLALGGVVHFLRGGRLNFL